jgi:hypothetical protein
LTFTLRKSNRLKLNFAGTTKSVGIDPGFANSKTAFTILEQVGNSVIHVIYSKQFENSSTDKMVSHTWNPIKQFKLNDRISKVFVDSSQPGSIRSVLASLGQFQNYEVWIEKSKKRDNIPLWKLMHVVPVSFTGEKNINKR